MRWCIISNIALLCTWPAVTQILSLECGSKHSTLLECQEKLSQAHRQCALRPVAASSRQNLPVGIT